MATDFFYFISSLPAVSPEAPAPFRTYEDFLKHASEYLSDGEMEILRGIGLCPRKNQVYGGQTEMLGRWDRFETFVRNYLAKYRDGKLKWNRGGDLRHCPDFFAGTARRLENLVAEEDMVAREKGLDRMRWEQLDDWSCGHEFDFSAVVIYALRLCILVRHYAAADNEDAEVMTEILSQAVDDAASVRRDEHTA